MDTPEHPQDRTPQEEPRSAGNQPPSGAPPAGDPPLSGAPPTGDAAPSGPAPDDPTTEQASPARRLMRSRRERVLAGVCGGLGQYFGVDPVIFRIAAVALTIAGGTGILLYLAAVVLVPVGEGAGPASPGEGRRGGLAVLAIIVGALLLSPLLLPPVFFIGAVLGPIALLLAIGLLVWWLVSGQGAGEGAGQVLGRSALGVAVLAACGAIALGGAYAAGVAGGMVSVGLVLAAGALLVVGAFAGFGRPLILPALALAVPVAVVSALGLDLGGGVGERNYRPAAAEQLQDRYKLGMGSLVVDLRGSQLPPGDTPLSLELGMGEAVVLVAPEVCVATRSRIGVGEAAVFDRVSDGIDIDHVDDPRAADGAPRLVVDAHIGMGQFVVRHRDPAHWGGRRHRRHGKMEMLEAGNRACRNAGGIADRGDAGAA